MTRFMPTSYFLIAVIGMITVHLLKSGAQVISSPWKFAGLVPLAAGVWLNISADNIMKRHQTAVHPLQPTTTLIEDGVFGYTRNPMYLGFICLLVGIALFFGTATPWVFVAAYFIVIRAVFITYEEQKLESLFGNAFADYQKRVRRWL